MVKNFLVDGVKVSMIDVSDISENEPKNYVDYVRENAKVPSGYRLNKIIVSANPDGTVTLNWELAGAKFERIRRITGRDARKVA